MSDTIITESTSTAIINAPIEFVDIADWVFTLPDAEYQRCSPAHIAAGFTTSDDGRRMSLNVETIGGNLMVQHYVEDVGEKHHVRLLSTSDVIGPNPLENAFTIYHHRSHDPSLGTLVSQQGELVREIKRAELWPSDPADKAWTDHTPQWFAGGVLAFSPDEKRFIYQDKSGRKLEIDLRTGELRHLN